MDGKPGDEDGIDAMFREELERIGHERDRLAAEEVQIRSAMATVERLRGRRYADARPVGPPEPPAPVAAEGTPPTDRTVRGRVLAAVRDGSNGTGSIGLPRIYDAVGSGTEGGIDKSTVRAALAGLGTAGLVRRVDKGVYAPVDPASDGGRAPGAPGASEGARPPKRSHDVPRARDVVLATLAGSDGPMHVSALTAAMVAKGFKSGGVSTTISRLVTEGKVVRPSQGNYALPATDA